MFNFNLCIPTEFHFGSGCESEVGKVLRRYGKKVLVVYGSERIFKSELGNKVIEQIEGEGMEAILYGGVVPNPLVSHVDRAASMCKEKAVNSILAIGGGSVMDTAKAIASRASKPDEETLPIINIVTAPATSSESNPLFVLTDDVTHEKNMTVDPRVMPKAAFLDPDLTFSLPAGQTAAGGFDAFCHAFERFFDLSRNSMLLDEMTAGVMKTIVKRLPETLAEPDNYIFRSDLMLAAAVAHNDTLGPGGDFGCHEISHAITEAFGLTHGEALAVVIPAWYEIYMDETRERFDDFARMVFDVPSAKAGLDKLLSFLSSCNLPTGPVKTDVSCQNFVDMVLKGRDSVGGGFKKLGRNELMCIAEKILDNREDK